MPTPEISREEWVRRCAERYKSAAAMTDAEALDAAEATYGEEQSNGFENGPEEAADADMECWEP